MFRALWLANTQSSWLKTASNTRSGAPTRGELCLYAVGANKVRNDPASADNPAKAAAMYMALHSVTHPPLPILPFC